MLDTSNGVLRTRAHDPYSLATLRYTVHTNVISHVNMQRNYQ